MYGRGSMGGRASHSAPDDSWGEPLWEGEGTRLQMDGNELRISWNGGIRVRHKNVISLALDQIQFVVSTQPPWRARPGGRGGGGGRPGGGGGGGGGRRI
jgi:hypothetical protein